MVLFKFHTFTFFFYSAFVKYVIILITFITEIHIIDIGAVHVLICTFIYIHNYFFLNFVGLYSSFI